VVLNTVLRVALHLLLQQEAPLPVRCSHSDPLTSQQLLALNGLHVILVVRFTVTLKFSRGHSVCR